MLSQQIILTFLSFPTSSQKWKNADSFAAHFEQHFNAAKSRTYLRKYMMFKLVKQLNPIGAMKTFTKPNCNLCMEERLTILKHLLDKFFSFMNNNLEICGACRHKTTLHHFLPSTGDFFLTSERVKPYNSF